MNPLMMDEPPKLQKKKNNKKDLRPTLSTQEKRAALLTAMERVTDDHNLHQILKLCEHALVEKAVFSANNNITWAARKLGVNRTTLIEKINRLIGKGRA